MIFKILAVKCNDNSIVLETLAAFGMNFDCASKVSIYFFKPINYMKIHYNVLFSPEGRNKKSLGLGSESISYNIR